MPLLTGLQKWQLPMRQQVSKYILLDQIYPSLPVISIKHYESQLTRQEQMLHDRFRICHTHLTHSVLSKAEDPSVHIPCNSLLTVEYILVNCHCVEDFDIICQNLYIAQRSLSSSILFYPKGIISFVHAIGLTNKL